MKTLSTLTLIFCISCLCYAQDRPWFIGIQPGITKEKFYEENEFDINVFPLVIQTPISKQFDLRLVTLANYHFGGDNQFSDLGINLIMPFHFMKKEETFNLSHGPYIGPMLGFSRNRMNEHHTINIAAEVGYLFKADKRFTLSLGMQYGRTYFDYDNSDPIWREHLALAKVNLGFWINTN